MNVLACRNSSDDNLRHFHVFQLMPRMFPIVDARTYFNDVLWRFTERDYILPPTNSAVSLQNCNRSHTARQFLPEARSCCNSQDIWLCRHFLLI